MQSVIRELRPILIYFIIGIGFTLLMVMSTGRREPSGNPSTYWDGREPKDQELE